MKRKKEEFTKYIYIGMKRFPRVSFYLNRLELSSTLRRQVSVPVTERIAYYCDNDRCLSRFSSGLATEYPANIDELYVAALANNWYFTWAGQICGQCRRHPWRRLKCEFNRIMMSRWIFAWLGGINLAALIWALTQIWKN